MPDHKTSDSINLRPRITVHRELHPELYERLKNVDPDLHNALIVQMLNKYAALEKYAGLGYRSDVLSSSPYANTTTPSEFGVLKAKKSVSKTVAKDVKSSVDETTKTAEAKPTSPTPHEMKEAIGAISWD